MSSIKVLANTISKNKYYKFLVPAAICLFILIAFKIARGLNQGTDFNVFYQAGKNFANQVSLYQRIGGAERYIYPPFAAMLFQIFSLFSLQVAGGIWIFINLFLWLAAIGLTYRLLLYFGAERSAIKTPLILGAIFSFRFVWYHLLYVQMNLLMLFLSLLAIYLFLKGKEWAVVLCLGVAISIKVLPIIVLAWLVAKSNYKLALKAAVVLIICTALPVLFRGVDLGTRDLQEYYITFIEPFKEGRVEPQNQNYSLSAAIFKWTTPTPGSLPYTYNLFNLAPQAALLIYKITALILLLTFAVVLVYSRFVIKKISLYEVSFILLFTHLISGITWEYHLVSFLFVFTLFFMSFTRSANVVVKAAYYLLTAFMFLNAIIGLDTVGRKFYYLSCGYSIVTILMLLLLAHNVYKIFFTQHLTIPVKWRHLR